MNPTELRQRLRQARKSAGLSQQQAASALGIPRTAVTQMEGGGRAISTLELTQLARVYGRPPAWFMQDDADDQDLLLALHRAAPVILDNPDIRREVDRFVALCREGAALERLLTMSSVVLPSYPLPEPRGKHDAAVQGEWVAVQERRRLDLGRGPVSDVAELVSRQGVWAAAAGLPEGVPGLFLSARDIGLAILVNAAHVRARRRFSYAHEYAHAVMDRDRSVIVSNASSADDLIEARADAFAAAFLVPAEAASDWLERRKAELATVYDGSDGNRRSSPASRDIATEHVALLARHFGVSYAAALYRLKALGHVSQREYELLKRQEKSGLDYLKLLRMDDVDLPEPGPSPELRERVARRAIEAYRREVISRGRLLEVGWALGLLGDTLLVLAEESCAG